ncbi:hypothetical protein VQ03_14515 [Methylobacterium tarhaniae]|uniref:Uncharacterized protein n=1 Tax=Methylobacterium tarhaniae TaxID=1187852 RepID=A0A0J6SYF2_9HYPH|nr:hypothetical protein [Methylobacterium tarhaniae]KMO40240.1 hypothetical protein VQ03_14515 [Methylobacterium tarhaniae]
MTEQRAIIAHLKKEHARLRALLTAIDEGRWWTKDDPSKEKIRFMEERTALIHAAISDVSIAVAHIGEK